MKRNLAIALCSAAVALGLAGCDGGGEVGTPKDTTPGVPLDSVKLQMPTTKSMPKEPPKVDLPPSTDAPKKE